MPPSLVPLARRWVRNYRLWTEALEELSALNRDLLRARREAERSARTTAASARKRRPP